MPTYAYGCKGDCGKEFDKILPMSRRYEPTEQECECGGEIALQIKANPNSIVTGVGNNSGKAPEGFKDVLRTIKSNSGKGNTIDV